MTIHIITDFKLTAFWIKGPAPRGPHGYGVTALSIADAYEIVQRAGYQLPDDKNKLQVQADVGPADLDRHVRNHMGPIAVRGLWYPFIDVGHGDASPNREVVVLGLPPG